MMTSTLCLWQSVAHESLGPQLIRTTSSKSYNHRKTFQPRYTFNRYLPIFQGGSSPQMKNSKQRLSAVDKHKPLSEITACGPEVSAYATVFVDLRIHQAIYSL